MRRALYVLLSTLLFLVLSPLLLLARKTRRGRLERFGLYRPDVLPEGGWPRVWLHGASAGDLQALAPMIGRFRERFPDARIFLTTMTDTGRAMAEQRLRAQVDGVLYAPWDLPRGHPASDACPPAGPPGPGVRRDLAEPHPRCPRRRNAGGAHQRPLLARTPSRVPDPLRASSGIH